VVYVSPQCAVTDAALEIILFHLGISAVGSPSVVSHSVDCGHRAGAMLAAVAMNEHRLIRRVVYEFQKLCRLFSRWPGAIAQADPIELHSGTLDHSLLASFAILLKVDYR